MIDVGALARCCHSIWGGGCYYCVLCDGNVPGCQAVDSVHVWYMCYKNRWAAEKDILFLLSLVRSFNLNWNGKILLWGKEFWVKRAVKKICLEGEYFIYRRLYSLEWKCLKAGGCSLCYAYRRGLGNHSWSFDVPDFLHMYAHIYTCVCAILYTHIHLYSYKSRLYVNTYI